RLKGCEIRQIRCTRQQRQHAWRRFGRIEFCRQTQPQNLGQINVKAYCGAQHFAVFYRKQAKSSGLVDYARGRSIQQLRSMPGVNQLQELRNELDVYETP